MPTKKAGGAAKPPPKDDAEQSRRFEEATLELEADKSGQAFKKAMKLVVPEPSRKKKQS